MRQLVKYLEWRLAVAEEDVEIAEINYTNPSNALKHDVYKKYHSKLLIARRIREKLLNARRDKVDQDAEQRR
jgi:hypothetical protein